MPFWRKRPSVTESPVLVVDALGFSNQIQTAGPEQLVHLKDSLDRQFHQFKAKIPFGLVFVTKNRVFGTGEFSTFRLNDMFVLFSRKPHADAAFKHLVASALLYHILLLEGFIPRGGLGFGWVHQGRESILGSGFIDAYSVAEKRPPRTRDICAIQVSPQFLARMPPSPKAHRLLCSYEDAFFLHPHGLVDPEMGAFDDARILQLLQSAGVNRAKLDATQAFLGGASALH